MLYLLLCFVSFLEDVRAKRIANAYSLMTDILASQKISVPNSCSPSPKSCSPSSRSRVKNKTHVTSDFHASGMPTTGHVMSKDGRVTNRVGYCMTDTVRRSSIKTTGVNYQQPTFEDLGHGGRVVHGNGKLKHSAIGCGPSVKNVKFLHGKGKSLYNYVYSLTCSCT